MEGEQSILNGTKDSFHSALLLPLNDMIDNDEDFEAPCFCAQQLLGALFGAVFAYIASLLFASAFAISLSLVKLFRVDFHLFFVSCCSPTHSHP